MSAYPIVALSDVSEVLAGDPAPQGNGAFAPDGPLFVRMQDVGRDHINPSLTASSDRLNLEWLRRNRLRLFPKDSILIPKSGASVNLNHRAKLGADAYVVSHLAVVVPRREVIDPDYLFWWSVHYDPRHQVQVTSLPSLNLSILKDAQVPLPPLDEQRRIVDILNRAASIERLRAEAREKLRAFIPALFIRMFGDPVENPMGWEVRPLGEVVENRDGRRVPLKSAARAKRSGKFPYYGASGIIDYIDDYIFEGTHLLISEDGANLIARSTPIAFIANGRFWVNNHAHVLAQREADLRYIEFALNLMDLREWISGSAQPKLNQANMNRIPLPIPPLDLQTRFADIVATARGIAATAETASTTASTLSASLMSRLFGEAA